MAIMQGISGFLAKVGNGLQSAALGQLGDQIVSEVHGKAYTAAMNNCLFFGSALIAGVTIPVNTATAATFTLHNPLGSGKWVELFSLDLGWPAAAASVVATILGSVSTQTPTATTQGGSTIAVPIGGGGVAQAKLYTAATITAITTHIPLIQMSTVTDTGNPHHVDFDGKVILAPGGIITLTSTPVQTAVSLPSFCWAEWPQ